MRRPQGIALVIVAGILGLLAVLALSFVTLSQLERRASVQRLYATQARLLARSGVEDALGRLSARQDPDAVQSRYGGENWDGDPQGLLSPSEALQQAYRVTAAGTPADIEGCPVHDAMRPSFFKRPAPDNPDPERVLVEGRSRGYTGRLGRDRASPLGHYALKVSDESAKLNLNGGFLDRGDRDGDGVPDHRDPDVRETRYAPAGDPRDTGRGWNGQLTRILDLLGDQPEVGIPGLGSRLMPIRPEGGWRTVPSPEQLRAWGLPAVDLGPYVTVSSWVDPEVVHPNGYVEEGLPVSLYDPGDTPMWRSYQHRQTLLYPGYSDLKKGRFPLLPEEGGRPPVNLNAAPRPVLVALLQGLAGKAWGNLDAQYFGSHLQSVPAVALSPPALAGRIADALVDFREGRDPSGYFAAAGLAPGPFRTRDQFDAFCDALVPGILRGYGGPGRAGRGGNLRAADLLKANFDPNTRLQKDRPDQLLWRWVDKSDLLCWSTEGNLGPTGTYTVSSLGRLLDVDGRVLAEQGASLTVEVFSVLRQTTQKDFVDGRVPDASANSYLSLSTAPFYETSGYLEAQSPCAWHTWASRPGPTLASTPCPPSALPDQAADFDGCLGLATTQVPGIHPSAQDRLRFLHHFDDGWDADRAPTPAQRVHLAQGGPGDLQSLYRQEDVSQSVWPSTPGAEPNTLLPDGMHAQSYRALDFLPQDLFPPVPVGSPPVPSNHGVFLYWIKDGQDAWVNYTPDAILTRRVPGGLSQDVAVGHRMNAFQQEWGIQAENRACPVDDAVGSERTVTLGEMGGTPMKRRFPAARWHLVLGLFDTGATSTWTAQAAAWGLPTDGGVPGSVPESVVDGYLNPFERTLNEDLLDESGGAAVSFTLGCMAGVLDEFAIYDFGVNNLGGAWSKAERWALDRFRDGRYYKEGDGVFLSGILEPAGGMPVRLLGVQWTEHLPTAPRMESLQPPFLSNDASAVPRGADALLKYPDGRSRLWTEVEVLPAGGNQASPGRPVAQGGRLEGWAPRFRYRVRFRTDLADPLGDPVLESAWFDDITFDCQPATGPRLLGWDGG